jgi:hypothetical protein
VPGGCVRVRAGMGMRVRVGDANAGAGGNANAGAVGNANAGAVGNANAGAGGECECECGCGGECECGCGGECECGCGWECECGGGWECECGGGWECECGGDAGRRAEREGGTIAEDLRIGGADGARGRSSTSCAPLLRVRTFVRLSWMRTVRNVRAFRAAEQGNGCSNNWSQVPWGATADSFLRNDRRVMLRQPHPPHRPF